MYRSAGALKGLGIMATETIAKQRLARLTVAQYHSMIRAGILTENDPIELLEGVLVTKMPHNPPHDGTILLMQTHLLKKLPAQWVLRIQSAITTNDSEPEPDLVIARGPARRYLQRHPRPEDIGLIIEVADTSLQEDRLDKARAYARAKIPLYWVVNLRAGAIEVYSEPKLGKLPRYLARKDFGKKEEIPLVLDGREIGQVPFRELLP